MMRAQDFDLCKRHKHSTKTIFVEPNSFCQTQILYFHKLFTKYFLYFVFLGNQQNHFVSIITDNQLQSIRNKDIENTVALFIIAKIWMQPKYLPTYKWIKKTWCGVVQCGVCVCVKNVILCAVLWLVAQSCPTLCDTRDCSPPGSSVHGNTPGKNIGVGCHAFLQGIFPTQVSGIAHKFFTREAPNITLFSHKKE